MMMLNPGLGPPPTSGPPQTPQSQYLAAALKELQAQPITGGPAQLGMNLMADGLMQHAQNQQGQYGPDGANAMKNATTDAMTASLNKAGVPFQPSAALPTSQPAGLMGLGRLFGGG